MKVVLCAPLLLLVVSCGGDQQPQQPPTVTVTAPATAADPTTPQQTAPTSPPPGSARSAVVPAVAGMNHQLAQDTMQAAGFYYLLEEDATGKGRLLVNDRNWVVVSQSPDGGSTAALDTKIVLRSKKVGE